MSFSRADVEGTVHSCCLQGPFAAACSPSLETDFVTFAVLPSPTYKSRPLVVAADERFSLTIFWPIDSTCGS